MTTVYIKLRDDVKEWDGIIIHDKNGAEAKLIKWSWVESTECNERDAKSYVANYGHLLEIVTPEDLSKQVEFITAFLKKMFPKEFGANVSVQVAENNGGDELVESLKAQILALDPEAKINPNTGADKLQKKLDALLEKKAQAEADAKAKADEETK